MPHLDWPHIYRVTLRSTGVQNQAEFDVLTWLGGHKALAMAMEVHVKRPNAWPVYDVAVWHMGPAPKGADGTVGHGPLGYLEDRNEF